MPEPTRQIFFVLGACGPVTSRDVVLISGREKAQISRAVNTLSDAGLVDRSDQRGPITLTSSGNDLFREIMNIAVERNELFCRGMSAREVTAFLDRTKTLTDRASSLFESDGRPPPEDHGSRTSLHHPPSSLVLNTPPGSPRQLVLPWLKSLTTYIQRSGSIIFKQEIGLSNFEWRILSQIGEYEPTTLSFLISHVSCDKSQLARTVKSLHAAGLLDRRDNGRMNTSLTLTREGRNRYIRMCEISIERDKFLFRGCAQQERLHYFEMLQRFTENARRMLIEDQEAERTGSATAQADVAPPEEPAVPAALATDSGNSGAALTALTQENLRLKMLLAEAMLENSRLREKIEEDH